MEILIGLIILGALGFFGFKWFLKKQVKKTLDGFEQFYGGIQENTVKEANRLLNKLLIEYSDNPENSLGVEILNLLNQNTCYVILTFIDNNDPNDNKTFNLTNSINFRKIKNGDIGVFTDFDIMKAYVREYISTEIIPVNEFLNLCDKFNINSITLNFTLKNPFILSR